ncbi:MAG: prepilin peptidase [Candidatus Saganbacteria bacterium]|nr:prepilin peptidase [Candidatus Saganbacteria bacterium]
MLYFFLFVVGAVIGSFLNVVIGRVPNEQSIVFPPSHCPICKHRLSVMDLFPMLSFLLLKGKCRYCSTKISRRYFVVELVTALSFVYTFYYYQNWLDFVFVAAFLAVLIVIAFIDFETTLVPDSLVLTGSVIAVLYTSIRGMWWSGVWGAVCGFLFFYLLSKIAFAIYKKEAIGFGDVELGGMLGVFLGWPLVVYGIFMAYLFGGIISLFLIFTKKVTIKDAIPFGPFLVLGAVYVLFFGTPFRFW